MELLLKAGESLIQIVYFLIILYGVHSVSVTSKKSKYDHINELNENNNTALSLRMVGLYIGIAIAMQALMDFNFRDLAQLIDTVANTGLIVFLFYVALKILDRVVLSGIDNDNDIKSNNNAVGLIEMGYLVSTGLIMNASLLGEGVFYSSLIFFLLGQLSLVIAYFLYTKLYTFDLVKSVHEAQLPAAILISSLLLSLGIIVSSAVSGPDLGIIADIKSFALSATTGIIILVLLSGRIVDNLFLPGSSIEQELKDNNPAAMLISAGIKISMALVISTLVL